MIARLILLVALIVVSTAFRLPLQRQLVRESEQRGAGLTQSEAVFIKAKIIEAAKIQGENIQENADVLQKVIQGGLGSKWVVMILSLKTLCRAGIRMAQPLRDKWIYLEGFGPYPWAYSIWLNRE